MIRMSTGLRDAVVSNYGVAAMLTGGLIKLYSGSQPSSADAPASGTLLGAVTQNGYAIGSGNEGLVLTFGPVAGQVVNFEDWVFKGLGAGEIGWWRFEGPEESEIDEGDPYSIVRLDGDRSDAILNLPKSVTSTDQFKLKMFIITMPAFGS